MVRNSGGGRPGGGRSGSGDASQAGGSSSGANARRRRDRQTNLGLFGRPPAVPHVVRVDVGSSHILDAVAKATIHAICCMRFSQYSLYDPAFMVTVLREFHKYFRYDEGISQAAGDDVVIAHIAKNYAGWLYEMQQRAARAVDDQPGTTIRDHQPRIVSDAVWEAMCTHWDADDFKKKSEQAKKNRRQLRVVHTTGSQSFEEAKSAMRQSLGRPPSMLEFWDRAHTPKDSTMSPAALAIRDRFQASRDHRVAELQAARGDSETLDSTVPPPEIELSRDEELALWVAAQDPPTSSTSRYRVLGLPRIPAYTLPRGSSQRQRPRASVGPSHTGAGLDDEIFQRVIRRQELPSRARLHQLAQDIAAGATIDSTGIPQEQFIAIHDEVLRLVVTLLSEAFGPIGSQPPPTQGGDGDGDDDGEGGDDDVNLHTP